MVKFSCFLSPIHHSRSKKIVHQTSRPMKPDTRESTQNLAMKASCVPDNDHSVASVDQLTSPSSPEGCWKSDDHNGNSCSDENKEFLQKVQLKKSQSLGNMIDKRREYGDDDITEENETDHDFSFGYSHEKDMNRKCGDLLSNTGSAGVQDHRTEEDMHSKDQDNDIAGPFESDPDRGHHKSIFSIGVMRPFDGDEQHDYTDEHSSGHALDSIHPSSNALPAFEKSHSATDLRLDTANSVEGAATHELVPSRSKSFGDLCSLNGRRSEFLNDEDTHQSEETKQKHLTATYSHHKPKASDTDGKCLPGCAYSEEECLFSNMSGECNEVAEHDSYGRYSSEKFKSDNQSFDGYEPHNYDGLRNEWREAERNDPEMNEDHQQDSLIQNWDDLTPEEFTTKRIEQWISQIDSYAGCSEQEVGESSHHATKKDHHVSKRDPHVVAGPKQDGGNLGMEVAYNYITSLNAASSSAQMSNLGLVAVPFLGAFTSLRVLNLSGNAIVRITSGALPRGLHVLNLSKNSISTIEGLRDLTRLRVLDLSFNRILRIGHGLAFCSSLKELYLASNKISEVEGLHRLLKLNVLDLRFNKISTAKALGQLAANYGSLQAIYLEGNPAQRNVGDEQLKKYLLSVLPHLVYYNKQTIRSSSSKDVADRSQRSLTSHQFDRGTRAEQSHSRRSSAHGSALHGRTSPAMSSRVKQSKNKHARLPPAGSKGVHHQQPNGGSVQLPLILGNPIRRTRSENML